MKRCKFIVVDAGATKICIGTDNADISHCFYKNTPTDHQKLIEAISDSIDSFCRSNYLLPDHIIIGMCGFIDVDGNLCMSNNISGISKPIEVRRTIQEKFSIPTYILNDAKLQSIAYLDRYNSYLYLVFGTGAGGSIITNKKIVPGRRGFAGEVCHLQLANNTVGCRCGKNGCLEAATSGRMFVDRFGSSWWTTITPECAKYLRELGQQIRHLIFETGFLFDPEAVIVAGHLVACSPFAEELTVEGDYRFDFSLVLEVNTWNLTLQGAQNLLLRVESGESLFT